MVLIHFTPEMRQLALIGRKLGFSSRSIAEDIRGAARDGQLYTVEDIEQEVKRIWKITA